MPLGVCGDLSIDARAQENHCLGARVQEIRNYKSFNNTSVGMGALEREMPIWQNKEFENRNI